jgi:hypothetical protein
MSEIVHVHARAYPTVGVIPDRLVVLTVLIKSIDGWRAYEGIVHDNSRNDPEYKLVRDGVRSHGNKLRAKEAAALFGIDEKEYAR